MVNPKLRPAVSKSWLIAAAGLMWSVVGILLCRLAWGWLPPLVETRADLLGGLGITGAVFVYYFGFSKIAGKNIDRLRRFSGQTCFFAFQAWKSYLVIGFMMTMGIFLRQSAIPKEYLAVVYITVGGALFLSSIHYYSNLWQITFGTAPDSSDASAPSQKESGSRHTQ